MGDGMSFICIPHIIDEIYNIFPNAKFVFIHRNPYEVFLSGANMASTTYGWMHLQQPSDIDLQEYILTQGEILHNEYFSCREDVLNTKNSVVFF